MPTAPTYPGVYIEEIPSAVRTITGVPTAITAFIGRALRGPVEEPVTINSLADFDRIFGGMWVDSNLGYSVRDFYINAPGGQAIIVRLAPGALRTAITVGELTLEARYPGAWGNKLRVRIDHITKDANDNKLFNLTVAEVEGGTKEKAGTVLRIETFLNVSVAASSPRRVDKVLANESKLLQWKGTPYPNPDPARPAKSADPSTAEPLWGNNDSSTKATVDGGDGDALEAADFVGGTLAGNKKGLYALEKADLFNLLVIPPYDANNNVALSQIDEVVAYCRSRRAMLLLDPPSGWDEVSDVTGGLDTVGSPSPNAALFFPRLLQRNPLRDGQLESFAPSGAMAGIFARTDAERGVWKAPAGLAATILGAEDLSVQLTDAENGQLNPLGVNCLRTLPAAGRVVWGARTRVGADRLADQWKYIPVRRLALFIEESLYRGTQWAVFEPNDEPLWSSLRLNIGSFMHNLFRQGAFQGATPGDAYLVKCDKDTTTQDDINRGIVNVVVGFAPLKPAEFVIIKIQQLAGQIQA